MHFRGVHHFGQSTCLPLLKTSSKVASYIALLFAQSHSSLVQNIPVLEAKFFGNVPHLHQFVCPPGFGNWILSITLHPRVCENERLSLRTGTLTVCLNQALIAR
jgi:hypothetical protein